MIDVGVGNRDYGLIVRTGLLMLGVALAAGVGTLVGSFLCARLSAKLGRDIRNALYDKILQFSAQDMEKFGTGSLITRALNDTNIVQQAFVFSVQMILPVPIICVAGIVMAFLSDWTSLIGSIGRVSNLRSLRHEKSSVDLSEIAETSGQNQCGSTRKYYRRACGEGFS